VDTNADIKRSEQKPGIQRCLDILSKELKTDYYKPSSSGASIAYTYYCDHFFLWLEAARKVGASMTPQNWGQGLAELGTNYDPVLVHDDAYSPGRFDGASTYRVGKYNQTTKTFVKVTGWLPLAG